MQQLKRATACGLLLISTSCMQYMVQPPQPSLAGTPQTEQANAYLGGQIQQPSVVTARRCEHGDQLARVLVKRNFWQGFVSWISLGMVAPATIVYTCANAGDPPVGGGF